MKVAPAPSNEAERLEKLKYYRILDTLPEVDFDDFTYLASSICNTPIALISLLDNERQWFKSKVGLDAEETPKEIAFCSHAILQDDVFIVPDSSMDERFYDNPLATDAPHVRFYAGAPLTAPSGEKLGTICVIDNQPRELDENQVKSLEALSRQIINLLELRLSKINAEEAVRAKALFLSTMSHEIRTPLNGILGCANILNDDVEDSDHRELVETITDCGDSLLCLINDVLDFSKLESGKMELERREFSLFETIKNVVQLFSGVANDNGTNVHLNYEDEAPAFIHGDPTRIRQIISNLLSNAIKFAPSGNVEIHVESKSIDDSDFEIRVSVQDDGIGIDQERQKKLFQPFSQVDASTSRKFGGSGLGLSICRALTDAMGSEISVESELGKGAVFSFTLITQEASPTFSQNQSPEISDALGLHSPMKILVAEDNKVNQLVIQKLLAKFGYVVDIASNGLEALDMLNADAFDLVFMDCFMPDMDGFQATKTIKLEPEKYGSPRVVALTASAMQEDRKMCIDAGMDGFLSKPIDTNAISMVLSESFELKSRTI